MLVWLLGSFAVYLGACAALAERYLTPPRSIPARPAWLREREFGGTPAWVTPGLERAKVVFVLAHGLKGNRLAFAEVARTLAANGYGAILPAMTGQDANPAPRVGFGGAEAELLAKVADEARRLPGRPKIVLGGVSMGGAAAWLATEKTRADGVITESAFADFPDAAGFTLDRFMPYGRYVLAPVILIGGWRSGIAIRDIVPERAAAAFAGPSVVMHVAGDRVVPFSHGERLARAARTPLVVVRGADHALARSADPATYDRRFLRIADDLTSK